MAPEFDMFSDEILGDPYETYRRLRELGDVVYVEHLATWFSPRYETVRDILDRNDVFSSASGVGFDDELNGLRKGSVLASDPPDHTRLRRVLSAELGPRHLRKYGDEIQRRADILIDEALQDPEFDGVVDLARKFPVSVVADLIGLPQEGRERLLDWADGAFNTFGPRNERTEQGLSAFGTIRSYVGDSLTRETLTPGSMGMAVLDAADRGEIEAHEGTNLLTAYLIAGMDTTVNSISNALHLFGTNPDQWAKLRAGEVTPEDAFNEVVRLESPVYSFSRTTTQEVEFEAATVPAGSRVAVLYGSANRDERKWEAPESFEVTRRPFDHVGFGFGVHSCAGQGLARIEGQAILTSLAARVERIEVGEPTRRINNVIRGLASLPVKLVAA